MKLSCEFDTLVSKVISLIYYEGFANKVPFWVSFDEFKYRSTNKTKLKLLMEFETS